MDIEKLMMAKAIMDRNTQMDKGMTQKPDRHSLSEMQMDDFEVPQAKYNIPQEFLAENSENFRCFGQRLFPLFGLCTLAPRQFFWISCTKKVFSNQRKFEKAVNAEKFFFCA